MCGFVAVITSAPAIDAALFDAMRDRLAHRGPDAAASWTARTSAGGAVGLGFRRLAVVDLSAAAGQPMHSSDGRLSIVLNGEIYNYVELRAELAAAGAVFRTRSDTEVLLAAYAAWGTECLSRLNGMFAFALWDAGKQQLFVARDRFGEKPLFYAAYPGGGLAFASEMKAFFIHPEIEAAPDPEMLAKYTSGAYYEETERTLFSGVRRLPAAHALVVDHGGEVVRLWRYWTPQYERAESYSEREAIARFRELLERSLRLRLRADVPIGTSLSGGLDSSMVVCTLARFRGQDPNITQNVFSARFDHDPSISEGPQIDAVVRRAGAHAFGVTPDPLRLMEESRKLHWHQEEPFLSASIYLQWCVARLAHQHATTVLLDGQGADELLAGYQYYFRTYQLDRVDRLQLVRLLLDTVRFNRRLAAAHRLYPQGRRRFNPRVAYTVGAALAAALTPPSRYATPYTVGVPPARRGRRLGRQLAEALQYNSLPALLRYADRNSMAFGREMRLPFLDYELVDWCVRLPDEAFVKDGWQKYILRRAGQGVLPEEIQWRADKVGYAAPLDVWLRGELKDWARERLFVGPITSLEQYDRGRIEALWTKHQSGAEDVSWPLWRWISLNEWLEMFAQRTWRRGG
jgi:asparagine synthase (glutamine-hydrolysing)